MIVMVPVGVDFKNWANDLNRSLPQLSVPFPTKGEDDWWYWVAQFINANRIYNLPTGSRSQFPKAEDWRKWAYLFIQSIQHVNLTA